MRRGTLANRVALLISGGFAAIWLLSILAMALVLQSEQEEMLDLELRETARVLLPVLSRNFRGGVSDFTDPALTDPLGDGNLEESLVWLLVDRAGEILVQSIVSDAIDRPDGPVEEGYVTTRTHVFYTTPFDSEGLAVRFGDPRIERHEAYRESFLAFLVPMLAILPLGYLLVGYIARAALRPLARLREEIAARDHGRLDPIDAKGQPGELQAITATLNGFMVRLARSLEGERAFATNAAHELRTPVAVALAQVQRLRADLTGDAVLGAERVEKEVKRIERLVARLLQLARADAGIGMSDSPTDIRRLLDLVIEEHRHGAARGARLSFSRPTGPVFSSVDPDAFAIVAGNLIDNAFQHGPEDGTIAVSLSNKGILSVMNDGDVVPAETLATLARRFRTNPGRAHGFGLGLHISDTIARQAGGTLTLRSPATGRRSGFEAELTLPLAQDPDGDPVPAPSRCSPS